MTECLLALGSNLGQREATLESALQMLSETQGVVLLARSRWYETPPMGGPPGQGPFLNGAAIVETTLDPAALLHVCHQIEAKLGRQRGERWAARTLDVDLLLYGDRQIADSDLTVPHPRMMERRFVLEPAAEIAPHWRHPSTGKSIAELLRELDQGDDPRIKCHDGS